MKRLIHLAIVALLLSNGSSYAQGKSKKGWQSLFDGKTLNGWRAANKDTLPSAAWSAADGVLTFDPKKGHGGDIVTQGTFTNFELSIDFNVSEGGNSGIKYFLLPNTSLGCEYQVLDDARHPDAKLGLEGDRKTGSLYDVIPAPANKPYKGAGVWNTARIVVKGNHVEHWLNGTKLFEYERGSEAFRAAIAKSKFKNIEGFSTPESSPILLQAHGDMVHYRNIKIKEL